ncbi:MAG: serine hydroxymethyltransferase [Parcubacteria group bacterium]|nr:serine hydroxymethyltransferase [Parcubacteria group bacterium]
MNYSSIQNQDPEVYDLIKKEEQRQKEGLEMIPSESYASSAVLEAAGSIFNNKYAENYPGKRYYGGCVNVDLVERLCQKRAREAFGVGKEYHVNVQPYSGSPANLAVYIALLDFGDPIMALRLDHGGHLTHGNPINLSGRAFRFIHYEVDAEKETLNYDEIAALARERRPKLIVSGFTSYPRIIDFKKMHDIAKDVGAISMADISHIAGLIVGGVHPSPFPFTDVVTTTTHKTLRGPRGAMIFCKSEYKEKIDKGVFPGMQGGPHEHTIAGIAVALKEAMKPEFREYAEQVVKNSKALAASLLSEGLKLVSGGSDNHLLMIDLRPFGPGRGIFMEKALEAAEISVNKQPIPNDPSPPYYPSGVRLGTAPLTSRGMKEAELEKAGALVARIVKEFATTEMPEDKEKRSEAVKEFVSTLEDSLVIKEVKAQVKALATKFPVPGID